MDIDLKIKVATQSKGKTILSVKVLGQWNVHRVNNKILTPTSFCAKLKSR